MGQQLEALHTSSAAPCKSCEGRHISAVGHSSQRPAPQICRLFAFWQQSQGGAGAAGALAGTVFHLARSPALICSLSLIPPCSSMTPLTAMSELIVVSSWGMACAILTT